MKKDLHKYKVLVTDIQEKKQKNDEEKAILYQEIDHHREGDYLRNPLS